MDKNQVKELFGKYINNECTDEELRLLENFLQSYQKEDLSDFFDVDSLSESKKSVWKSIHSKISKKERRKRFVPLFRHAALFLILVGAVFLYVRLTGTSEKQVLEIESNPVLLELEDGSEQELNIQGIQSFTDTEGKLFAKQSGSKLVYDSKGPKTDSRYNKITVPYGKKFQIQLSDGTLVHLNAGTTLRFPVNFQEGKRREVFLNGEAYFAVAKDERHPFHVHSGTMEIEVLGTEFNLSSYTNEPHFIVLAEGSVLVRNNTNATIEKKIVPNEKATLFNEGIDVSRVDLSDYLSWISGELSFNDEPFEKIIDKIERKYNVNFKNQYKELNDIKFRGRFNDESIIDLLEVFKTTAGFDYQIEDNEIIIKPPDTN